MDRASRMPMEDLEDQVRRMILSSNSPQPQPTVRLPPPQSSQEAQQPFPSGPAPPPQSASTQRRHDVDIYHRNGHPELGMQNGNYSSRGTRRGRGIHAGHPLAQQPHQGFDGVPRQVNNVATNQRVRYQQHMPLDPDAFQRRGFQQPHVRQQPGTQQLYNPEAPRTPPRAFYVEHHTRQAQYLEQLATTEIRNVDMSASEHEEKQAFRSKLQQICHEVCDADPDRFPRISLECFGSFQSGFATAGSDMDLVIVVQDHISASVCFSLLQHDLPRALEQRLLELGYGARLLTRTRVPIIKICERPDSSFLEKLRDERENWNSLPDEKKYPHLYPAEAIDDHAIQAANDGAALAVPIPENNDGALSGTTEQQQNARKPVKKAGEASRPNVNGNDLSQAQVAPESTHIVDGPHQASTDGSKLQTRKQNTKIWTRERKAGALEFPKSGVGIQSDINFFNPLGLHNTQLLRCYSLCDPRVRPMVVFVKAWAKRRKVNSSYSGTLSSYGFVLMVLHYLVNIAQPPVLPNLQQSFRPTQGNAGGNMVDGWNVDFWHNESEITAAAQRGQLTANREPLGSLLAGFFRYYSSQGGGVTFRWMGEVLSLRTVGGLLTKDEKGWVKAMTEEGEGKKIQHRYLFCIEDPFELSHNVARTVTHNGIVAIRDEFRRAMGILSAIGNGMTPKDGELFAPLTEIEEAADVTEVVKAKSTQNAQFNRNEPRSVDSALASPKNASNGKAQASDHRGKGANKHAYSRRQDAQHALSDQASPKARPLDFADSSAFPTLGGPKMSKRSPKTGADGGNFSEISGDKARVYLEEVKRKKDEEQAESTAMGAAEAVLMDSD